MSNELLAQEMASATYEDKKILLVRGEKNNIYLCCKDVGDALGLSRTGFINLLKRHFEQDLKKEIAIPYVCASKYAISVKVFLELSDVLRVANFRSVWPISTSSQEKAKDFLKWVEGQNFHQIMDISENNILAGYAAQVSVKQGDVEMKQMENKMQVITISKAKVIADTESRGKKLITIFLGSDGFIYLNKYELARAMGVDRDILYARTRKFGFLDFWVKIEDGSHNIYCKKNDALAFLRSLDVAARAQKFGKPYYGIKQTRKLLGQLELIDFDTLFNEERGSYAEPKRDSAVSLCTEQSNKPHLGEGLPMPEPQTDSIVSPWTKQSNKPYLSEVLPTPKQNYEEKPSLKSAGTAWSSVGSKTKGAGKQLAKALLEVQIDTRFFKLNITIL